MFAKSGLTIAAAFGIVLLTAGAADAQIITVNAGFAAGPPPTSTPFGSFTAPGAESGAQWQIVIDFGTMSNGVFTAMQNSPTDSAPVVVPANGQTQNYTWSRAIQLTNPWPANHFIRARLQKRIVPLIGPAYWETRATGYNGCAAAPPE
jgi:hypothetical protein